MGRFDALMKALGYTAKEAAAIGDDAAKVLEKIPTDEVADTIWGKARGEYMDALDEVYGPAEKRSILTGHTKDVYHGTSSDIKNFEPEKYGGLSTLANDAKNNIWATTNPTTANEYAQYASNKLRVKDGKLVRAPDELITSDIDIDDLLAKGARKYSENGQQNVMPLKIRVTPENSNTYNLVGKPYNDLETSFNIERFINESRNRGKPVTEFLNTIDSPFVGRTKDRPLENTYAISDTSNIRSKFAAFDPRFKDSKKLMAGGLVGANAMPSTEEQLNPFSRLADIAGVWETAKEKVSKPLAKSLNLSGNPQDEAAFNEILKIGLDPTNFLPGAAGLVAGAAQMFTPTNEERVSKESEIDDSVSKLKDLLRQKKK